MEQASGKAGKTVGSGRSQQKNAGIAADVAIVPLTPERWTDLVDLFGPERGATSGCWCMWHRLPGRAAWNALGAAGRRDAFRA
ncbi:hypothetical protein J8J27_32555, partial [Mycobacterium tuberculosis]|nr:hypothetical protein [Mycobacterium tuberculosis]